jgi:hypothetical protein
LQRGTVRMTDGIYLTQSAGDLVEMIERAYEPEDLLQGYLIV